MKKFEEGHAYRADDSRFGAVVVEKRTAKMVFVSNQDGVKWGMKIRTDNNGNEYAFEFSVPERYKDILAYRAEHEC